MKLQLLREYTNLSKLDSSSVPRAWFSDSGFGETSLVRPDLDIVLVNKINYYTPADYVDRGSWSDFRTPAPRL
jgi:hypothetical protein